MGGGIAFYINAQLPSRTTKIENPSEIEILAIERSIHKNKILVAGIREPPYPHVTDFTSNLEAIKSKLSGKYGKLILMGDFNMTTSNLPLSQFGYVCTFFFKYRANLF